MDLISFEKSVHQVFSNLVSVNECSINDKTGRFYILFEDANWVLYRNDTIPFVIMESGSLFLLCVEALFQLDGKDGFRKQELSRVIDEIVDCSIKEKLLIWCKNCFCTDYEVALFNLYTKFVSLLNFSIGEWNSLIVFNKSVDGGWEIFENLSSERNSLGTFVNLRDALIFSLKYFKKGEDTIDQFRSESGDIDVKSIVK